MCVSELTKLFATVFPSPVTEMLYKLQTPSIDL